ncbi:MAG TPA: lipopolysaccharide heptosyltransferase I [Casimicrobiaceae bacterium]|nr:lipopolysaccharide heptosyltransferase I [Casimicrobiaceae bacterium]
MSAVLVIRPSSLGDIVYALAVVSDIHRHRPDSAIDWVAERGFAPLVALCPDVRTIIPFALRRWRREPLARTTWRDIGAFRRNVRAARYAAILDLQEQVKGAIIARTARGRRHGFDRASVREPLATLAHDAHHHVPRHLHFVERCRRLAGAALGYPIEGPPRWHFALPAAPAELPARPYVALLTATSRADKLWPEAHWRALIEHFDRAGLATLLLWGSPEEEARSRRLAAGVASAIVPSRVSMPDAAALLARAELAVGVDTGFTHLAAALGTATIGLFFATDPTVHGVACTGTHALDLGQEHRMPAPDDVIAAAGALLRAAPRC